MGRSFSCLYFITSLSFKSAAISNLQNVISGASGAADHASVVAGGLEVGGGGLLPSTTQPTEDESAAPLTAALAKFAITPTADAAAGGTAATEAPCLEIPVLFSADRTLSPEPAHAPAAQPAAAALPAPEAAAAPAPLAPPSRFTDVIAQGVMSVSGLPLDVVQVAAFDGAPIVVEDEVKLSHVREALNHQCCLSTGSTGSVAAIAHLESIFAMFHRISAGIWFLFEDKWYGFSSSSAGQTIFFELTLKVDDGGSISETELHIEPREVGRDLSPPFADIEYTITRDGYDEYVGSLDIFEDMSID